MEYMVTSLKKLTNKRWLVCINYEPAFALYSGELKKFKVKEETAIQSSDYEEIMAVLSKRAVVRAMNLLKAKDYAEEELRCKLKQGYYPSEAIESAVNYVSSFGYLDDYRYAFNYLAFRAGSKSRRQIEGFLQQKGIASDIISSVCEEYYGDSDDVEFTQIVSQLSKKLSHYTEVPDYESRQKLLAYYYRKGYSADIVRKALDVVVEELYNN